jgi:hypothetical protein
MKKLPRVTTVHPVALFPIGLPNILPNIRVVTVDEETILEAFYHCTDKNKYLLKKGVNEGKGGFIVAMLVLCIVCILRSL